MKFDPREEFDKWVDLLKKTNNEDMLKDPYDIWIEAWSLALMTLEKKTPTEVGETREET